ncbi:MAG: ribose transport system substrate-binding protein [Acidobacteriota bacterium]|jgi:ribose transport system substrate-binding protein|nr:ribose transport system substrate-binding protein [Acidobacteriota bacterium]
MKKGLVLVLLAALLLGACQRGGEQAGGGRQRIALVMKTANNPFFIEMQKGAEEAARKLNVELVVQAAEREVDVEKQMQIVENLIQTRVNALCVTPSGSREIVPAIDKANRAGIPVIIVDTRVDAKALAESGGKVATFIGSDNYEGGKLAGEFLAKKLGGKGKVAVLEGIPGHETGDSRMRGFRDALKATPGVEIVASQTANWERDQGFNVFQNILQSHPDVQAVFACSDLMALGAVEAIAAAKKTGQITVVGFDATSEARDAILKGTVDASVAQSPAQMGALAVENAVKLLKGEQVNAEFVVPIKLITKENASEGSK